MPRLEWWEGQTFLGVESTFGDDRSLTNCVLRDWRILYEKNAVSHTIVPTTFRAFVKQQTRWKRSWTRESLMVSRFIWRKHPVAAAFTYLSIVLPLIAPVAALHSIAWGPLMHGTTLPLIYAAGLYSLAIVYSLYFVLFQDRYSVIWMYGILFVFFYLAIMLWQTYYAIATCRTAAWGTRPATAGLRRRRRGRRRCLRWRPRIVEHPAAMPAPVRPSAAAPGAGIAAAHRGDAAAAAVDRARCCCSAPRVLRAPVALFTRGLGRSRCAWSAAATGHDPRAGAAPASPRGRCRPVSLGPVYGRWLSFPGKAGHGRPITWTRGAQR